MSSVFSSYKEGGATGWKGPPTAHYRGMLPNGHSLAWASTLAIGICAGILLAIFTSIFYMWQHSSTEAAHTITHPRQRTHPARTRRAKHFARRPHAASRAIISSAAAVQYVTPTEPALPLRGNGWAEGPCDTPCTTSNTACLTAACPVEGGGGKDTSKKNEYPPATTQHAAGDAATDVAPPSVWTGPLGTSPGIASNAPPTTCVHNDACGTFINSAAAVQYVTPTEPALPLRGNGWAEGPCDSPCTTSNTACLTAACPVEGGGGKDTSKKNEYPPATTQHAAGDAALRSSPGKVSTVPSSTSTSHTIPSQHHSHLNTFNYCGKIKHFERRPTFLNTTPSWQHTPLLLLIYYILPPFSHTTPPKSTYNRALRVLLDTLTVSIARQMATALLHAGPDVTGGEAGHSGTKTVWATTLPNPGVA